MRKFSPEYFVLSDQDRENVIKYQTEIHQQNDKIEVSPEDIGQYDDFACAMFYRGLPFSNAFFVHERDEIWHLQQSGIDPLNSDRVSVVTHPSYKLAHAKALEAEYSYHQQLAHYQHGFDLPIHLLILLNPSLDMISQDDAVDAYSRYICSTRKVKELVRAKYNVGVWDELPDRILPSDLKNKIEFYYAQLIKDEPLWRVVAG